MPIEAVNGRASSWTANRAPSGMLRPMARSRSASGFSSNAAMRPSCSKRKMPICVAVAGSTACAAMVTSAFDSRWARTSAR